MFQRLIVLGATALALAAPASTARAQSFFHVWNDFNLRFDYASAQASDLGFHSLLPNEWGPKPCRALDGTIFAITSTFDIHARPSLYRVDELTGAFTWLRSVAIDIADYKEITGAAIHPGTGQFYFLFRLGTTMALGRLDPATGNITGSWLLGGTNVQSLAFDAQGIAYALEFGLAGGGNAPALRRIDLANPALSPIVGIGLGMNFSSTIMAFDPATGKMIGIQGHSSTTGMPVTSFEIDLAAGIAINKKFIDFASINVIGTGMVATTCLGLGSYGRGCTGSGSIAPVLRADGCPFAGASIELAVSDALGASTALYVFGAQPGAAPLGGGCSLLVQPLAPFFISLPTSGAGPGAGSAALIGSLPAQPTGYSFSVQAFVLDPGNPIGASATNGVVVTVP